MRVLVSGLSVFPVKSLRGSHPQAARVERCGLAGDRRWMVVDPAWRFMTQREHPRMALVQAAAEDGILVLTIAGAPALRIAGAAGEACRVQVWRDSVAARDCGPAAASWLSKALATPCRLVHLADPQARRVRPDRAEDSGDPVSFADGFPLLLAVDASLAAVNARLAVPVPMLRFRPNVTVTGAAAWEEDRWRRLRIGSVTLRVAKPCERCIMTTLDPETGLQRHGNEPLRTMARFRRNAGGKILFGQNLVPEHEGEMCVGDAVEVLEEGEPPVFLPRSADFM